MGSSLTRFVKRGYLCDLDYEMMGIFVSPIKKKWAGIRVSPILKWAGVCELDFEASGCLCEPDWKKREKHERVPVWARL